MRERASIPTGCTTLPWLGSKDQQNKMDVFLSAYGVLHVIIKSRKECGKKLKEWIMTDIIPRGLQSKINQVTSKHNAEINALGKQIEAIQFE